MKEILRRKFVAIWYRDTWLSFLLLPLSYIFLNVVWLRRFCYRHGLAKSTRLPVPLIVVGNLTAGGTGKTPLVIWLVNFLREHGYRPGIISRGYGGQSTTWPRIVTEDCDPREIGDESCLIYRQTGLPLVVGPERVESAKKLLSLFDCDVIVSDDGLQHYKLQRDVEIIVIDGERRFGNGYVLPAGPLREPLSRLSTVDFPVVNGQKLKETEYAMQLEGDQAVNLASGEMKPLADFKGSNCHAIAGIGNPGRFFHSLERAGLAITPHAFGDHYPFEEPDLAFLDGQTVLMTEKDAVKCVRFAKANYWYVPVKANLEPRFAALLLNRIKKTHD
jgi:tetraacyldisaccharide 4'-kinase